VLGTYEKLEAIPADANAWEVAVRGAPALAASLAEHRADAFLFRQLATLRTDVPLAESLDDLRWRGPDVPALTALAEHWGDDAIVERATRFARR
jgi:5'-3' exonuclease